MANITFKTKVVMIMPSVQEKSFRLKSLSQYQRLSILATIDDFRRWARTDRLPVKLIEDPQLDQYVQLQDGTSKLVVRIRSSIGYGEYEFVLQALLFQLTIYFNLDRNMAYEYRKLRCN